MAVVAFGARASLRGATMPIFHVETTDSAFRSAGAVKNMPGQKPPWRPASREPLPWLAIKYDKARQARLLRSE